MRVVEAVLVLAVAALTLIIHIMKDDQRLRTSALLTASLLSTALLAAHAMTEGLRMQLLLVYAGVLLFPILLYSQVSGTKTRWAVTSRRTYAIRSLWLLSVVITAAALWLFPVQKMPAPSGPYIVGTRTFEVTDTGRAELYGEDAGEDRRIRFQIWYPADTAENGVLTKWMYDGREAASGIPKLYDLPGFLLDHTALVDSHSYAGIPISRAEAAYPVVLLSHGWTGFMNLHADLAEMLSSHGYIAVSISHTYGATVTVFDNGDIRYADSHALPDSKTVEDYDSYSHALVKTYALDDQAVLDFLETDPELKALLEGRIDYSRIGILGHSTGGGGAVYLSSIDSRIQAVFGMDAWVEPVARPMLEQGLQVPSCFLRSEQWETGPNNDSLRILFSHTPYPPVIYQIEGGNHQDFSMLYMYRPITELFGFSGPLDTLENAVIQQDFVLRFFDQVFFNDPDTLDLLTTRYETAGAVREFDQL